MGEKKEQKVIDLSTQTTPLSAFHMGAGVQNKNRTLGVGKANKGHGTNDHLADDVINVRN